MATTAKTTIELNGKLYDARSGKIIGDAATMVVQAPAQNRSNGMVVDGFMRRSQSSQSNQSNIKPKTARTSAAHTTTKLEKSKTLMRPAVKKPASVVNKEQTPQAQYKKENAARHVRAASSEKSSLIQRFNRNVQPHTVIKKEAVLPVVTQPAAVNAMTSRVAHLATSTEAHLMQSVDVIEESLRSASAHLEQFEDNVKKGFFQRFGFRNKFANIAVLSFAGIMLFGFFAYQNVANIEMRLAAARSGISASLPGYSPAGFDPVRGIKSEPGKVSITFQSNTDDKKFTVSQQASNWSSDSLLTNHVLASKQPYQTYQDAGKTVYIYDNSTATWVNGGIWYRIDGNASLTSDQLLRIANSL